MYANTVKTVKDTMYRPRLVSRWMEEVAGSLFSVMSALRPRRERYVPFENAMSARIDCIAFHVRISCLHQYVLNVGEELGLAIFRRCSCGSGAFTANSLHRENRNVRSRVSNHPDQCVPLCCGDRVGQ